MRGNVLNEALEVINGDRQDTYGNPEDSHTLIAALWSAYVGVNITAREAAEMLVLFKVARMKGQKPHLDNYRDAAGYIGIAADMVRDEMAVTQAVIPSPEILQQRAQDIQLQSFQRQFVREQAR